MIIYAIKRISGSFNPRFFATDYCYNLKFNHQLIHSYYNLRSSSKPGLLNL